MKNANANSQYGAAHLVLIAIIMVVLLGGIGYLYWHNFMQTAPETAKSTAKPAPTATPKRTDQSVQYVSIPEWGVRFALTDKLKDADVKAEKISSDAYPSGKFVYYDVSTRRIRESDIQHAECHYGSPVSLDRYAEKQPDNSGGVRPSIKNSQINGYYFYTNVPSASPCDGFEDSDELVKALQTLESIPKN